MDDPIIQTLHDLDTIHLNDRHEVRDWANSLAINEVALREAVAAVGTSGDKVRQFLASQKTL